MDAEAGRIIRMEPRCPDVEYEDTGAGVRSEPLDAETRMKEYKRSAVPRQVYDVSHIALPLPLPLPLPCQQQCTRAVLKYAECMHIICKYSCDLMLFESLMSGPLTAPAPIFCPGHFCPVAFALFCQLYQFCQRQVGRAIWQYQKEETVDSKGECSGQG